MKRDINNQGILSGWKNLSCLCLLIVVAIHSIHPEGIISVILWVAVTTLFLTKTLVAIIDLIIFISKNIKK